MKIDIGCGLDKAPGFFGIDRQLLPGVDLVWDLNEAIPLPDNSVDFVMASRSLPYVQDLHKVMSELYRLCIHKAVVCILSPYAHSFVHMSNPYLKQKFDQFTPRYWTSHFYQPSHGARCPDLAGYVEPQPDFDFRLLRMELFYKPPYVPPLYETDELELLQDIEVNVVHEIMYHLVAVKLNISHDELEHMSRQTFLEPRSLEAYRRKRQLEDS
ncbi:MULTISPECIES: methyltransferase domain-containing protein [unclassified Paenibacillus]|uniref:methyltransferase domain-containing protein n=1 Tax=unclassified Paenibacillus TaxID=185978 RepID=UPI0036438C43